MPPEFVTIYAPNVNTGGGLILLEALLLAWPNNSPLLAYFDVRTRAKLSIADNVHVTWVKPTLPSRMYAELKLWQETKPGNTTLCFHGLPPLLPNPGRVFVFMQNKLLIDDSSLAEFRLKTRIRISIERVIARLFRKRVSGYLVQTPSMKRLLDQWYQQGRTETPLPEVQVAPFAPDRVLTAQETYRDPVAEWDFVYIASGDAHKNHSNLFKAWQILADAGLRPSLALTLSENDHDIRRQVTYMSEKLGLAVRDLGMMPHENVLKLYSSSRALIYPSYSESLGLPLIEAHRQHVPIIAGELDYVRDVCTPSETFDPTSPLSIARAAARFLNAKMETVQICSAYSFWQLIFDRRRELD